MPDERTAKIAALNDRLRQTGMGGRTFITRGLQSLGPLTLKRIVSAARSFSAFNASNDPYSEHDFGAFTVEGHRILFKIDYYAPDHDTLSLDPSDEAVCRRVLTIMLADEY